MSFEDRYLITEMLKAVTEINPDYPDDINLDGKPLLKIAEFIYKRLKLTRGPENHTYEILPIWRQLYTVAFQDKFYGSKSLSTISNNIQEFYQTIANGNGKLSGNKLKQKLTARYNKRK